MSPLITRRLSILLLVPGAAVGFGALMTSCSSSKKAGGGDGAYASYSADGHYNPYPTGSQYTKPQYQEYNEAPPPPPETKPKSKSTAKTKTADVADSDASSKKTTKKKPTTTASKSASTSKTASTKSTGSGTVHVVKKGDTLSGLAKRYHTTISKIKSANGLTSDLIRDGKKLKIP